MSPNHLPVGFLHVLSAFFSVWHFDWSEERFYFGDNVLPCIESGIPLLKTSSASASRYQKHEFLFRCVPVVWLHYSAKVLLAIFQATLVLVQMYIIAWFHYSTNVLLAIFQAW
jgi:Na+/phosphate symporter